MFPYWLLFSIFAAGSLQYRGGALAQRHKVMLVAAAVMTALMIGFRYEVGGDWTNYQRLYEAFRYLEFPTALQAVDPGYAALNLVGSWLGLGIWFVNLACGAIFMWGLLGFARKQANPWLAVLVAVPYLIIVVAMGYTRQAVAIGLILKALSVVDSRKMLLLSVYIVCAAAFHKSAIVVLPLVALATARGGLATGALLMATAVLVYYLFVGESVDLMMRNYVEAGYSSQGAAIRLGMNIPPALLFLLFQKRFGLSEHDRKLWRNFAFGSFVALAFLILTPSSAAVDRISLYLIPLQMVVWSRVPQAFGKGKTASAPMLLAVIAYSALIQFVWLNFAVHADWWVPYRFYPLAAGQV